jgi:hypothetical protein
MRASSTLAFRLAGAVGLLGLAGGCVAIPPALVIASYVIDVGSFVATGKTATDHAISTVAQQDCAVMYIFEGYLCHDEPDYQLASAGVLEPLPPEGQLEPPMALTPLVSGDIAALPQIASLPDATLNAGPITRDSVLSGASYLAEGLIYPTLGDNGG